MQEEEKKTHFQIETLTLMKRQTLRESLELFSCQKGQRWQKAWDFGALGYQKCLGQWLTKLSKNFPVQTLNQAGVSGLFLEVFSRKTKANCVVVWVQSCHIFLVVSRGGCTRKCHKINTVGQKLCWFFSKSFQNNRQKNKAKWVLYRYQSSFPLKVNTDKYNFLWEFNELTCIVL